MQVQPVLLSLALGLAVQARAVLDQPGGPRSAAMGGAFAGVPGSPESVWFNPSSVAVSRSAGLSIGQLRWAGDISVGSLAAAWGTGQVGVGLVGHMAGGSDVARDGRGKDVGTLSYQSTLLGAAVAGHVPKLGLAAGLLVKWREENVVEASGTQWPSDKGLHLDFGMGSRLGSWPLRASAGIRDFSLSSYSTGWYSFRLYTREPQARLGLSFLGGPQTGTMEAVYEPSAGTWSWHLGWEFSPFTGELQLAGRLGYNSTMAHLGSLQGGTLGLGIGWSGYWLDYAFVPLGDFGASHRWALRGDWSLAPAKPRQSRRKRKEAAPDAGLILDDLKTAAPKDDAPKAGPAPTPQPQGPGIDP